MKLRSRFAVLLAALWWGSLATTGFLVVPMLFATLDTPAVAGTMAAKLFTAQSWLAIACGLPLLLLAQTDADVSAMDWAHGAAIFILGGMLLALLSEFAIAPRIVARDSLKLWHAVGSGMYLLQWVCAATVLWKLIGLKSAGPS